MKKIQFDDGMRNRSRTPRLVFLKKSEFAVYKFTGKGIEGVCAIISSSSTKNGKWSGTVWDIAVSDNYFPITVCQPFEGWGNNFSSLQKAFRFFNENEKPEFTDAKTEALLNLCYQSDSMKSRIEAAREEKRILSSLDTIEPEIDFDFDSISVTTRILWFSRHEMIESQLSDLRRIYGEIKVNMVNKTIKTATELIPDIEQCDVIAVVCPTDMQAEILKIAGNRPVIFAKNTRNFDKDGKIEFDFAGWFQIKKIEIEIEEL